MATSGGWIGGSEGKAVFFEKKQKTFGTAVADSPTDAYPGNKSFLVVFFKKELLALLAFIVGLKAEAKLLRPLGVRVFIGGGDARGAALAADRALDAGASALISFGLAGGLSPALAAGDIVVPANVLLHGRRIPTNASISAALGGATCDALLAGDAVVASVAGKAERWAGTRAEAVDLESGAVASAAGRAVVPYGVLRAVCDPADRALPPAAVAALDRSGGIGVLRLIGSILLRPGQIGSLVQLSGDAAKARRALLQRVETLGATNALGSLSIY